MKNRPGISLLEVMFSMGVISVGLLGVTAILPLALNQIGQGRVLDNASRVGQNATTLVRVHEMLNPVKWRFGETVTNVKGSYPPDFTNTTVFPQAPNEGFCIDPLFVDANTNYAVAPYKAQFFPYYDRTATTFPRMHRISLAAGNPSGMMRWAEAERIFMLQDELVFDVPDEKNVPPIQNFGSSNASRMYDGSTSWLATLSPNLDASNQLHDSYVLSVVVFNKRNLTMPIDGDTERLLSVDWRIDPSASTPQYYSGLGGGDMVLQSSTIEGLVGITAGKWVMLMGNVTAPSSVMPRFRWYRVVATSNEPVYNSTTMAFHLNVTLQGPDWDSRSQTGATFMPGVVAVYERSVRLESGSLWAN